MSPIPEAEALRNAVAQWLWKRVSSLSKDMADTLAQRLVESDESPLARAVAAQQAEIEAFHAERDEALLQGDQEGTRFIARAQAAEAERDDAKARVTTLESKITALQFHATASDRANEGYRAQIARAVEILDQDIAA